MCLGSAACITHKAQALTSHAATWHACATINPCEPSMAADVEAHAATIAPPTPTAFPTVETTETLTVSVEKSSTSLSTLTEIAPVLEPAPIGTVHWAPQGNEASFFSVGGSELALDVSCKSIWSNSSNGSKKEGDECTGEDDDWFIELDKLLKTTTTAISYQKRQAIGIAFFFIKSHLFGSLTFYITRLLLKISMVQMPHLFDASFVPHIFYLRF